MCGALSPNPLHTFTAWCLGTRITLPITLFWSSCINYFIYIFLWVSNLCIFNTAIWFYMWTCKETFWWQDLHAQCYEIKEKNTQRKSTCTWQKNLFRWTLKYICDTKITSFGNLKVTVKIKGPCRILFIRFLVQNIIQWNLITVIISKGASLL